jgi:hypothetical protein
VSLDWPVPAQTGGSQPWPLDPGPSYYAVRAERVRNDLMLFAPDLSGLNPHLKSGELDLKPPPNTPAFVLPPATQDLLELSRRRDRLLLFRQGLLRVGDLATGLALFLGTTVMAAHAPRGLRVIFDGPVHLGPAVFNGGGMGAGIGGRLPRRAASPYAGASPSRSGDSP